MGRVNHPPVDPVERAHELTWSMVDDCINDAEWGELQSLLTESSETRQAYIGSMQLHTDLLFHFQGERPNAATKQQRTAVLGFLGEAAAMPTPTFEVGG